MEHGTTVPFPWLRARTAGSSRRLQEGHLSKFRHGRLAAVASSALLALVLIGPASVSAATPLLTQNAYTLSPVVRNGDYVAYEATIYNPGPSTVSQLYLLEGDSLGNRSNGDFYSAKPSQGTCNATGPLYCSFGQLKPSETAKVTVVYLAPAAPETQSTFYASFNTTGLGSGSGDNSHGDQWDVSAFSSLTNSDDFGGRYVANNNATVVQNLQLLSSGNPHSTKAYAPGTDIYVSVQDVDCTIANPDPACTTLSGGFGQISKVNVNNGVDVNPTPTLLHFTIQTYASEVPSGKNANNIYVVHTYPTGATTSSTETITTRCTFSPKSNPVPSNPPCIVVTKLGGGSFQIDVWTFHNGQIRLF